MKNQTHEILVVDDEPDIIRGLARILESRGWHVRQALSGCEAVEMAIQQVPQVILMDMVMPDMNGIEAFQEIRRLCGRVPVIFMSGFSLTELRAREMGASAVLSKPMDLGDLFAVLEKSVRRGLETVGGWSHEGVDR